MARSKPQSTAAAESGEGGKKKGALLPAVVVAVGLLGGGYLMGGRGGAAQAAAPAHEAGAHEAPAEPEPEPGEVLPLDSITLNLADGRFLKVGLALQLTKADKGHGEETEKTAGFAAPALDEAIAVLGERSYAELSAPGGRAQAKEQLSRAVAERYDGKVLGVYFTEFVMQ